jgi:peptide/nickel transport system permease protein
VSRSAILAVISLLLRRMSLLVVLLAVTFLAVTVLPTDAARATLDPAATAAEIAARRDQLGLDRPLAVRVLEWMRGLITGDLGVSARGQRIWDVVGGAFGNTLTLGAIALGLTVVTALALGGISLLRPEKLLDRAVRSTSALVLTLPEFAVANGLVVVFALWLPLFPSVTVTSDDGGPGSAAMLVLPALALAIPLIGWNTRIVRSAMAEQLQAPQVDSAIMDGLPRRRILVGYVLPGAVPTIAAGVATSVGMVLGGAVTVETIFNFPGLGAVLVDAIRNRDAPLVAAVVALIGAVITVVLVIADLLRTWTVGATR